MTFRRKLLAAAVGSALGAASSGALATYDMDNDSSKPIKYTKELKADDSNKAFVSVGGQDISDVVKTLGWKFATGEAIYIQLNLTMGGVSGKVKFRETPQVSASLSGTGVAFTNPKFTIAGGAGQTYVQYLLAGTSVSNVQGTDPINFSFGSGFEITGTSGDIELTYSVSTNKEIGPTNALQVKKVSLVQFADSFEFSSSGKQTSTAEVETNFVKFSGDKTVAPIAKFKFIPKDDSGDNIVYAYQSDSSATLVTLGTVFSPNTTLEVVGDFTMTEDTVGSGSYTNAGPRVFISDTSSCSTSLDSAETVAADKAVFKTFNEKRGDTSSENYVCVVANGSTILKSGYSLVLKGVGSEPAAGATGNKYNAGGDISLTDAGEIKYNGSQLITPYMTLANGYISRIFLSNTGSVDINYTATVVTDDGNNASLGTATSGTVKAGTNLQINTSALVSSFSTKQRGAALFNFVGAGSAIQGVYQTVNLDSLEVQSIIMQRPGGGDGN